jgi:proteasome lid subunit RPN8/RPN11
MVEMLRIGIAEYEQIRLHGEEAYPNESCGILLGKFSGDAHIVLAVVRCVNARKGPQHNRYSIDPVELLRVQRDARDRELDIVGFYHSHPDHPPQWSSTDLDGAHWIGFSYVITQVDSGIAAGTKAFVLAGKLEEDKSFVEEGIIVGS